MVPKKNEDTIRVILAAEMEMHMSYFYLSQNEKVKLYPHLRL